MAYTQQGIIDQLGAEAQVTGGSIIVNRDGKNVEVAKVKSRTGELVVTDAGKAILAEKPVVEEDKPVATRGRRKAVEEVEE